MKRFVLPAVLGFSAGCGPKDATIAATPIPIATISPDELTESERASATPVATVAATVTPASTISQPEAEGRGRGSGGEAPGNSEAVSDEELPEKSTLLWKIEAPLEGVPKEKILMKEGTLKKVTPPDNDENQTRIYPYAIDYWGITRTDLSPLLEKNVGKPVRIKGHYRKIWSDGTWTYEVDPVSIVLLPK